MVCRALINSGLVLGLLASAQAQEDPVLRARAQRVAAQGISDGDLPPVPRGIIEPPPLPPPEAHVKDSRSARKAKGKASKKKSTAKKSKSSSAKAAAHKGKAK